MTGWRRERGCGPTLWPLQSRMSVRWSGGHRPSLFGGAPQGAPEEKAIPLSQTSAVLSRYAAWGLREHPVIIGELHDGAAPPRPHQPRKAGFPLLQSPSICVVSPRYAHTGCRPSIILSIDTFRPTPSRTTETVEIGYPLLCCRFSSHWLRVLPTRLTSCNMSQNCIHR